MICTTTLVAPSLIVALAPFVSRPSLLAQDDDIGQWVYLLLVVVLPLLNALGNKLREKFGQSEEEEEPAIGAAPSTQDQGRGQEVARPKPPVAPSRPIEAPAERARPVRPAAAGGRQVPPRQPVQQHQPGQQRQTVQPHHEHRDPRIGPGQHVAPRRAGGGAPAQREAPPAQRIPPPREVPPQPPRPVETPRRVDAAHPPAGRPPRRPAAREQRGDASRENAQAARARETARAREAARAKRQVVRRERAEPAAHTSSLHDMVKRLRAGQASTADLRAAIVMSEILRPPVAMRPTGEPHEMPG